MSKPSFEITYDTRDGVGVVHVLGRLSWETTGRFRDVWASLSDTDVVVDLTEATTDSAGTGALLGCLERASSRCQSVVVVVAPGVLHDVLSGLSFDSLAPIVETVDDALRCLAERPAILDRGRHEHLS